MLCAMISRSVPIAGLATALIVALAACAPQEPAQPAGPDCAKDKLTLKTAGKLTIGTDDPAYEPWFKDNKPENGTGFEGAVAYAVANRLGFAKEDVVWVRVTFNNAIAPGPKSFDFDIN